MTTQCTALSHVMGLTCRKKTVAIIMFSVSVSGCGPFVETHPVTMEESARLSAEIKIIYQPSELSSLKYTTLQRLEAWSCKNKFTDPDPTRSDALAQMRMKASAIGANGIKDVYCSNQGTSLMTNCWSSILCDGTAIKVDTQ
jgi:RcsF lipoprotein